MVNYSLQRYPIKTNKKKLWPYNEHYTGEKDENKRRSGYGENRWSGAESLECYKGQFLWDTMHGLGDYSWRYLGAEGLHITYEGHFYANRMHGYGTMSYPDGRFFKGLYYGDLRWGPGVESHASAHEDVGLWRGDQLVRLAWKPGPMGLSAIPDFFIVPGGQECVNPRIENTSSCDCLKQRHSKVGTEGAQFSSDMGLGVLCHTELFEDAYYGKQIKFLRDIDSHSLINTPIETPSCEQTSATTDGIGIEVNGKENNPQNAELYFSWNRNPMTIQIMKHCYKHEDQRKSIDLNLTRIMSGPRKEFRAPGEHELDCRLLLMASYLGKIAYVAQLLSDRNVHPDVTEKLGNTALMYATCGNQPEMIHYLVAANATVDSYNDAGFTPLGVALMIFTATQHDYTASNMVHGLVPPNDQQFRNDLNEINQPIIVEWNIIRESPSLPTYEIKSRQSKSKSKTEFPKSFVATRPTAANKTVINLSVKDNSDSTLNNATSNEEEYIYKSINQEFEKRVNKLFSTEAPSPQIPYLFDLQTIEGQTRKKSSPKFSSTKSTSKFKLGKDGFLRESDEIYEIYKSDKLSQVHSSILQLLSDGADPKLVRCPQPALVMALAAESADLVLALVQNGADVNEAYPEFSGYTALDIAISRALTPDTAELIRALVDSGATVDHRLPYETMSVENNEFGPTLLHVLISREPANDNEKEIRLDILELLVDSGCDPNSFFQGSSVIDAAMTPKNLHLLNALVQSPRANLNGPINSLDQSILVKMFTVSFFKTIASEDRLQILTNLLVIGADPLLQCHNGSEIYLNLIAYGMKNLQESFVEHKDFDLKDRKATTSRTSSKPAIKKGRNKSTSSKGQNKNVREYDNNNNSQTNQKGPNRRQSPSHQKSQKKFSGENHYREYLDLVCDWARLMHTNWIQANLMKELVEIVNKCKHRSWHLIIRDHKNQNGAALWLNTVRCLQLWDMLKSAKHKVYRDKKVLKHLLCIVHYYNTRQDMNSKLSFREKEMIESDVSILLKERGSVMELTEANVTKPVIAGRDGGNEHKFNICFECSLPLESTAIRCDSCDLVSFCNKTCLMENCTRGTQCHPCCDLLIKNTVLG